MALLPIHEFPDAVLRRKAEPVVTIDDTLQRLIDDMIQTMYDAPGIGLAAPQIGLSLRLFVVDVTSGRDANALSLPGVYGPTPRATHVIVRGTNRQGETVEVAGEGLLARAFQHEMDHLQGMLFFNRMGPAARDIVIRKFKRAQRQRR